MLIVVCNTGPLISMLQSDSFDVVTALFGHINISDACLAELRSHGWGEAVDKAGLSIISHKLTDDEAVQAEEVARRIAAHPASKGSEPAAHQGEAEVMVLAQRSAFDGSVLLLEERVARAIATELNLRISGFAGVLLLAASEGLLTADEVKQRLERCRQQGTHYGAAFIERIYQAAKEGEL